MADVLVDIPWFSIPDHFFSNKHYYHNFHGRWTFHKDSQTSFVCHLYGFSNKHHHFSTVLHKKIGISHSQIRWVDWNPATPNDSKSDSEFQWVTYPKTESNSDSLLNFQHEHIVPHQSHIPKKVSHISPTNPWTPWTFWDSLGDLRRPTTPWGRPRWSPPWARPPGVRHRAGKMGGTMTTLPLDHDPPHISIYILCIYI